MLVMQVPTLMSALNFNKEEEITLVIHSNTPIYSWGNSKNSCDAKKTIPDSTEIRRSIVCVEG